MNPKNLNRLGLSVGVLGLVALIASGAVYWKSRTAPAPAPGPVVAPAHADSGQGEEAAEKSDLDRPVDEMWAARCEHDVLQYTCDECRYEVGAVKLSPDLLGSTGKPGVVSAGKAATRSYEETLPLTGEVQLSEGRTIHVTSPLAGTVVRSVAAVGRAVSAGDVLFEVDSHDVAEAKAEYLKKTAALGLARKTAEREAALFAKEISAEADVQEAEARRTEADIETANARSRLARLGLSATEIAALGAPGGDLRGVVAVRAPRGGTILEGHANVGERVEPGKEVFLVSDLSEVWVWVNLREADLSALAHAGGKAAAEVEGLDGRKVRGTVDVVSGTVSEDTRTARARVVLANAGGRLRPGMFVKVALRLPGGKNVVAVPRVAVLADEGRPFVFVHKEGDYWVRRPVTLGSRFGDLVEIREGLAPGQTIIADGSFLLKSDVLRKKMGAGCAD